TADIADHFTAFDRLDNRRRRIECRRGRLEFGKAVRNPAECGHSDHDHDAIANLLLDLRFGGSLDIHSALLQKNFWRAVKPVERAAMRARRMEFKRASSKLHAQLYSSPLWLMSKPVPTV